MSSISTDNEAFVYTNRGVRIPHDVVCLRVDPSVTSIPANAFHLRKKLAEVELCEGLVEIGEQPLDYENEHPQLTQKDL
jgi:hypothetical protein